MIEFLDKKRKPIIRGVLIFILFWYSFIFQYIPVLLMKLDVNSLSEEMQVVLSTFSSIILLAILLIIYRKDLKEDFQKLKKDPMKCLDTGFEYWLIGLVLMMGANFILNFVFQIGGANNEELVQQLIKALPWMMLIDAGFIAPINEELVFRKTLKDVFSHKWVFTIFSFLLFGLAHVVKSSTVWTDYLYIIPYGFLGASFALADYKTDNIFTSIIMHMIHNTILVIFAIIAFSI